MKGAIAAVLCLFALAQTTPFVARPAAQGREWRCAELGAMSACGDVSGDRLREVLGTLRGYKEALQVVLPDADPALDVPLSILLFWNRRDFLPFVPPSANGKRNLAAGAEFTYGPTGRYLAMYDVADKDWNLETALYAYTRQIFDRYVPAPTWLAQGFADFYSTFDRQPVTGKPRIGRFVDRHVRAMQNRPLIPLAELTSESAVQKIYRDEVRVNAFRGESWALVHYLIVGHGGRRNGQLAAYVQMLRHGLHATDAFAAAFGPASALESELFSYVRREQLPALVIDSTMPESDPEMSAPHAISRVDAECRQINMLAALGQVETAEVHLRTLLPQDTADPRVRHALARTRLAQGRDDEALDILSTLSASQPDDFAITYDFARALQETRSYDRAYETFVRSTSLNARSDLAWFGASVTASALHRDADADTAFEHATHLTASRYPYRVRVLDVMHVGRPDAVARAAAAYLAAFATDDGAEYMAFFGALGALQAGDRETARTLLDVVRPGLRPGSWSESVLRFLDDSLPADALLRAAKDDGQRTEAHAYVGVKAAVAGDSAAARSHLQWVKEHGVKTYIEYTLAVDTLERLK